jgi:hypothetical protein
MSNDFKSRTWGAEHFHATPISSSLEGVVNQLPPNVKQAMYAAANRGLIKRGTWAGCAFNAAADGAVQGFEAAASFFDCPVNLVYDFVRVWDRVYGTDEEATIKLKDALLKAGLFAVPGESRGRRVMRETVWKSQETRMREEFEAIVSGLDLELPTTQLAQATVEIGNLLSACS